MKAPLRLAAMCLLVERRGSASGMKEEERVTTQEQGQTRPAWDRRSVTAALAAAGVAGPVLFAVAALVHSLLREDHSLVAMPISALAAEPSGWVQDLNFVVFGSLMIAYAIGFHLEVCGARWGVLGPAFLSLSGIGLVWAAVFPATDATGAFQADRVPALHTVGFAITFLGTAIGLITLSRRMARDPRWQSLTTYALATGIAMLILFLAGALVRPPDAPFHPWLGLFQWILLAVWFPCMIVLALRLLRVARAADALR